MALYCTTQVDNVCPDAATAYRTPGRLLAVYIYTTQHIYIRVEECAECRRRQQQLRPVDGSGDVDVKPRTIHTKLYLLLLLLCNVRFPSLSLTLYLHSLHFTLSLLLFPAVHVCVIRGVHDVSAVFNRWYTKAI